MTDLMSAFEQARARPTVLCDIDNTLAFMSEAAIAALNTRFDLNLLVSDQKAYRIETYLNAEQAAWLKAQTSRTVFYLNIAPDFRAIDAVAALRTAGFNVVIATNRRPELRGVTMQWLSDWGVGYDGLILGPTAKVDYCTTNKNVVAVDDDPAKALLLPPLGATLWIPRRPYTPAWTEQIANVHVFEQWNTVLTALGV